MNVCKCDWITLLSAPANELFPWLLESLKKKVIKKHAGPISEVSAYASCIT